MKSGLTITPLALAITSLLSVSAQAQEAQQQLEKAALEVIQVTAQKRVQSLQDVPVSISTINGEKLADNGITQMEEMSAYVPNFTVSKSGQGYNIYMRGLGSGPNQGFEQTVGTYVDGVYRGRAILMRSAFVDLDMVEVLRGPQGTLFGMNTTAGALNLTTRNPGDDFEANIQASYVPTFNKYDIEGAVSGGLSDDLRARLALKYESDDGYLTNTLTNEDIPARESLVGRLTLDWDINDKLNANIKYQRDEDDINGRPLITTVEPALIEANSPLLAQLKHYTMGDLTARANPALGEKEFEESSIDHLALNVRYELEDHELSFVTGWQSYDLTGAKDQDSTARTLLNSPEFNENYDQFSQEIRLTSSGKNQFDYIVGAYWQSSELHYDENSLVYPLSMRGLRDYNSESDLWALFAQLDYQLTDKLNATLGLRYTDEEKQGSKTMQIVDPQTGTPINQLPLVAPPALAGALAAFGLPGLPGQVYEMMLGTQFRYLDPLLLGSNTENIPNTLYGTIEAHQLNADRDESSFTPSFNLSYDWGKSMLYVNAAKGFKSGGFDARSNLAGNLEFEEEQVTSFEVGAKLSLDSGAAELNIALFSMAFDDLQTSVFDGQVGFIVENAGEASTTGLELDGRWAVSENIRLFASLGLIDFEWDSFQGGKCFTSTVLVSDNLDQTGRSCDLTGETNALVPEVTASLALEHFTTVFDEYELKTTIDVNYRSDFYTSTDLNPFTQQDAYAKVNWRSALISEDGWEVALFGKNLTNEITSNFSFDTPFTKGAYNQMVEPGRSFGVQVKYTYY